MGIMAGCTIVDHPVPGPVCYPFAMGSAEPVPLLAEVALAAQLITVVKINFSAFLVFQIISLPGDGNQCSSARFHLSHVQGQHRRG